MAAASHHQSAVKEKPPRFAVAWTLVFVLLGIAKALYHEPWRDEAGLWLNATRNGTLAELYSSIRYGGHPYLWLTLAWFAARLFHGFFALQAMTLAAAAAGAYVMLRFSPFNREQSLLLVFGYYFAFEYSVVNRPYVLLLLLVPLMCLSAQRRAPAASGLCAAVLAQSSIYGTIIVLAFAAALFPRMAAGRGRIIFLGPAVFGAVAAVLQIIPPPDSGFARATYLAAEAQRLSDTVFGVWRGLLPIPGPYYQSWSTNFLDDFPVTHFFAGAAALALLVMLLRRAPRAAWMFGLLSITGLLLFSYVKFQGTLRHNGHYFMALLIAIWLTHSEGARLSGAQTRLLRAVLWLQLGCAIYLSASDFQFPFSSSVEAARIVSESGESARLLIGEKSFAAAPVSLYLHQPIYYPDANRYGTFIRWDNKRETLSEEALFERIRAEMRRTGKASLLILNRQISEKGFRLFARTARSIAPDESYYLYLSDVP